MPDNALLELNIPELTKVKSGKVREVFDLGEHYLFVASDRISAFDVIMPNGDGQGMANGYGTNTFGQKHVLTKKMRAAIS